VRIPREADYVVRGKRSDSSRNFKAQKQLYFVVPKNDVIINDYGKFEKTPKIKP